jgi:hypothetical protein
MMLTEADAKAKWCPLSMRPDTSTSATNRRDDGSAPFGCSCIASACMAWRWKNERDGAQRVGFCGAFGNPL